MALHMGCWTEGVTPASTPVLGLTVLLGGSVPGNAVGGAREEDS